MKPKDIKIECIEGTPQSMKMDLLVQIYKAIFEDAKPLFFKLRLHEKEDILSLIAFSNNKPVAFKIGYRYDETTFYSWVGGVLTDYRKQGIASSLASHQEKWAKRKDYKKLRTKSMNRFKPMMILNLKNGFNITKVYTNDTGQTKIIFEKNI